MSQFAIGCTMNITPAATCNCKHTLVLQCAIVFTHFCCSVHPLVHCASQCCNVHLCQLLVFEHTVVPHRAIFTLQCAVCSCMFTFMLQCAIVCTVHTFMLPCAIVCALRTFVLQFAFECTQLYPYVQIYIHLYAKM